MSKFKGKPIEVQAWQFRGETLPEALDYMKKSSMPKRWLISDFTDTEFGLAKLVKGFKISFTGHRPCHHIQDLDWIVQGRPPRIGIYRPADFECLYEPIDPYPHHEKIREIYGPKIDE